MQTSLTFATDNRLPEILDRLRSLFPTKPAMRTDPLSQLVFAVASDGAAPSVGAAVFNRLRAKFPRWSDLRDAAPQDVARVLVGVPNAAAKAEAIPALLQAIEAERGVIDLDFLGRMTTDAAGRWLERLPGVTADIAAATLSFSDLRRPVIAIGRAAARPVRRLGLAQASAPLSALPRQVAERAPAEWKAEAFADFARGMARLSRTVCHEGKPDCRACPLKDLCTAAGQGAASASANVIAFPGASRRSGSGAA